jgi:hypothetical protein
MILRLNPEPVVPRERVAHDKATQDVVRPQDTDDAKSQKGEADAER